MLYLPFIHHQLLSFHQSFRDEVVSVVVFPQLKPFACTAIRLDERRKTRTKIINQNVTVYICQQSKSTLKYIITASYAKYGYKIPPFKS